MGQGQSLTPRPDPPARVATPVIPHLPAPREKRYVMRIPTRLMAAGVPAVLALSACMGPEAGGEDEEESNTNRSRLVVGATGTPESALLAEIYGQALEAVGEQVRIDDDAGARDDYLTEVERGRLSLVPEYNGDLLAHVDPEAEPADTDQTNERLHETLPSPTGVLEPTPAQSATAVTVTSDTADSDDLASIDDLDAVAGDMVFGGPPGFENGPRGLPGLEETYDLAFTEFHPMGQHELPEALAADDIQVATLRTADAAMAERDLVPLEDPRGHFGAGNIVPLVHDNDVDGPAREAVNAASAELDSTNELRDLNERVSVDGEEPERVATDWLESAGLD